MLPLQPLCTDLVQCSYCLVFVPQHTLQCRRHWRRLCANARRRLQQVRQQSLRTLAISQLQPAAA